MLTLLNGWTLPAGRSHRSALRAHRRPLAPGPDQPRPHRSRDRHTTSPPWLRVHTESPTMNMTDEQLAFAAASFCDRIISNRVWHLPELLEIGPAGSTIALRELEHRPEFWRAVTKEVTEELRALRTLEMANDRLAAL
jgi:hypothetical protein